MANMRGAVNVGVGAGVGVAVGVGAGVAVAGGCVGVAVEDGTGAGVGSAVGVGMTATGNGAGVGAISAGALWRLSDSQRGITTAAAMIPAMKKRARAVLPPPLPCPLPFVPTTWAGVGGTSGGVAGLPRAVRGGVGLTGVGKNEIIATNRPRHPWIPAYAGMIE